MPQKKLKSACVKAFELGNKQDAKQLLPWIKEPADIRTEYAKPGLLYTRQISLLHLAAGKGWMDIVVDLITKYKCDTNCKDSNGRTPLHYAVISNHLEVVRYFINEQHCDPMTRDNDGNTPLHIACRYNRLKIVEYLIREAHCNPSCENNDGDTPLHIACDYGHIQIVQYLLSTGKANPLAKNNKDKIPLYMYKETKSRLPMLHLAAREGWMNIIIDLITKYKCDTNHKDSQGRTPLHYAVLNNRLEVHGKVLHQ